MTQGPLISLLWAPQHSSSLSPSPHSPHFPSSPRPLLLQQHPCLTELIWRAYARGSAAAQACAQPQLCVLQITVMVEKQCSFPVFPRATHVALAPSTTFRHTHTHAHAGSSETPALGESRTQWRKEKKKKKKRGTYKRSRADLNAAFRLGPKCNLDCQCRKIHAAAFFCSSLNGNPVRQLNINKHR